MIYASSVLYLATLVALLWLALPRPYFDKAAMEMSFMLICVIPFVFFWIARLAARFLDRRPFSG